MADERVRRIQELRRSSAATPVPSKKIYRRATEKRKTNTESEKES